MSIADWKSCIRSISHPPRGLRRPTVSWVWTLWLPLIAFAPFPALAEEATPPPAPTVSAEELAASANADLAPEPWWEPSRIESHGGELAATLDVRYATHHVRDHHGAIRQLHLRSYNGQLVGPTLVFRAGDTLRIKLVNRLPADPDAPADPEVAAAAHHAAMSECPNVPHDFDTTNLHTHGLHISPKEPADDVLRSIEPGGHFDYVFPILPAGLPPGQPAGTHYPGTFWYHAHRHGSTAIQLASGMAGALIVKGDVDKMPELASANERLFILQQIAYGADGTIEDFGRLRNNWDNVVRQRTRINGRLYPLIELRPGQIERWRLIDSGVFADLPLSIVPENPNSRPFQLFQIAADGITFEQPRPVRGLELAPGNRADLLVLAPTTEGRYFLYKTQSKYDLTTGGVGEEHLAGPERVAEIVVRGEPCRRGAPGCGSGIPTKLDSPTTRSMLPPIERFSKQETVTFSVEPSGGPVPKFMIEDDCYKPGVILPKFELKRGDAQEWMLINTSRGPHPFHIHVNAFQLMDQGGVWRDTVMIPPATNDGPGKVRIRTRFERFDGTFVTHCHILTHEDLGMMQEVRINP